MESSHLKADKIGTEFIQPDPDKSFTQPELR